MYPLLLFVVACPIFGPGIQRGATAEHPNGACLISAFIITLVRGSLHWNIEQTELAGGLLTLMWSLNSGSLTPLSLLILLFTIGHSTSGISTSCRIHHLFPHF